MIELRNIPLNQITESPFNPRRYFSATAMEELTASIKSKGILQPILVRPNADGYQIVAGARRFRAAGEANLDTIPAVVRELDDCAALEAAVIENLQREDVHPLEEAEGFELLLKQSSYKAEELGEKIGKSRAYIYARLKLLDLCTDAREAFYERKLDASTALLVARIPGKVLQKRAVKELLNGFNGEPLSYRTAREQLRRNFMLRLDDAAFKLDDAELIAAAGSCTDCPKRTGNDRILFDDVDDLNVCTDPKCFDDKRVEHYLKLKENAMRNGIRIITGVESKKIMPYNKYELDAFIDGYIALDTICDDDDENRTYREILGADAPVSAIIESASILHKNNPLIEVAEPSAMADALARAGFTPSEDPEAEKWAQKSAEAGKEQLAKEKALDAERAYRKRLFIAVGETTGKRFAEQGLTIDDLRALAANILRALYVLDGEALEEIMEIHSGPQELDDEDAFQRAAGDFTETIASYNVQEIGKLLADAVFITELHCMSWDMEQGKKPERLIAEASRLGIDVEALKNPAAPIVEASTKAKKTAKKATPSTPAAQAQEKVAAEKKAKPAATPSAAKTAKAKSKKTPAAPSKAKNDLKKPAGER